MKSGTFALLGVILLAMELPALAYNARMEIYLENTGNETIYVAWAYHEWKGYWRTKSGWGDTTVSGWYEIKPGRRKYMLELPEMDEVTFACTKRGGYVVYGPAKKSSRQIGVDEIWIDPVNGFRYTGQVPKGYVPIKRSFALKLSALSDGTLKQTISIPSNVTDTVIPFAVPQKPAKAVVVENHWKPFHPHPTQRGVYAAEEEGKWAAMDGYVITDSKTLTAEWVPGLKASKKPYLVAGTKENRWDVAPGYYSKSFVGWRHSPGLFGANDSKANYRWRSRLSLEKFPGWRTSTREGWYELKDGYMYTEDSANRLRESKSAKYDFGGPDSTGLKYDLVSVNILNVSWVAGQEHSTVPMQAAQKLETWVPANGYRYKNPQDPKFGEVEWYAGDSWGNRKDVVSMEKESLWRPIEGRVWDVDPPLVDPPSTLGHAIDNNPITIIPSISFRGNVYYKSGGLRSQGYELYRSPPPTIEKSSREN